MHYPPDEIGIHYCGLSHLESLTNFDIIDTRSKSPSLVLHVRVFARPHFPNRWNADMTLLYTVAELILLVKRFAISKVY